MKKQIMRGTAIVLAAGIWLFGCETIVQKDEVEEPSLEPGKFVLAQVHSPVLPKVNESVVLDEITQDFDLGEVHVTTDFYFVLANAGDTDIVDVSITNEHPAFRISPDKISSIKPVARVGLLQVLRLSVIHGKGAGGIGPAPVLEPGITVDQVRIEGKTTNAPGDTLDIGLVAGFSAMAKLADVRIEVNGNEVNLTSPSGSIMDSRLYTGSLRRYDVSSGEVTIENTGNVNLEITPYASRYPAFWSLPVLELEPGESEVYPWPLNNQEFPVDNFSFKVDAVGTITEHQRLPIQNDGMVYIVLDGRFR